MVIQMTTEAVVHLRPARGVKFHGQTAVTTAVFASKASFKHSTH